MNTETAKQIVSKEFKTDDIKYIGRGSDSCAFRVNDNVIRFTSRDQDQYRKEAAVCDFIRPFISVPIPAPNIVEYDDIFYVVHKMIMGNKWSWHKFMFHPRRQRNLADSLGRFMAELHGVDVAKLKRAVPAVAHENIPYVKFDDMRQLLAVLMGKRRLDFFCKNYERIVGARVPKSDMVLIHMGIKGPNSVVDDNGTICGVFDFCNCGIYERWREFAIMYLCRNKKLFNQILRAYEKYSGVKPNRDRIIDLAVIEFMWEKRRRTPDGEIKITTGRFFKKNVAAALGRFYGLPLWCNKFIYMQLSLHEWWTRRRRTNTITD